MSSMSKLHTAPLTRKIAILFCILPGNSFIALSLLTLLIESQEAPTALPDRPALISTVHPY